jgi:hypothetical protein
MGSPPEKERRNSHPPRRGGDGPAWGKDMDGGRCSGAPAAQRYLLKSRYRMYPEHKCTARRFPDPAPQRHSAVPAHVHEMRSTLFSGGPICVHIGSQQGIDSRLVAFCNRRHSRRSASRRIVTVCLVVRMTTRAFFQNSASVGRASGSLSMPRRIRPSL